LYDDIFSNAPGFCTYALINAASMQCSVTGTYAAHISLAEVRTAIPGADYKTGLVESLADGGQCYIASSTTLDFYPQYVPPLNASIVVTYRGAGRAVAEVIDANAIAGLASGTDDGVRGLVRMLKSPAGRTQSDCENAALALLDDNGGPAWVGTYKTWSDFLPGDIFPGDAIEVNVPSQNAECSAIVRRVQLEVVDPANDRGVYAIEFATEAAVPVAISTEASATAVPMQDVPVRLAKEEAGSYFLPSLTNAQMTQVTSTTVLVDAGISPANGYGIEVRTHDFGWGAGNDRNLLGRFSGRTFSLPRLGRSQTYFLRLYDVSSTPRYSRYAAAVHIDCPLGYTI
jgi:hypothetical protein